MSEAGHALPPVASGCGWLVQAVLRRFEVAERTRLLISA